MHTVEKIMSAAKTRNWLVRTAGTVYENAFNSAIKIYGAARKPMKNKKAPTAIPSCIHANSLNPAVRRNWTAIELPRAMPTRKVTNMIEKAYVELPMIAVSALVQATS